MSSPSKNKNQLYVSIKLIIQNILYYDFYVTMNYNTCENSKVLLKTAITYMPLKYCTFIVGWRSLYGVFIPPRK